jgi:antitoxin (DNA-binding transcriptional repressor) of toxin-antitoxin stability system
VTQISTSELNRSPSSYVSRAAKGEKFDITLRGQTIASLGPPSQPIIPAVTVARIEKESAQARYEREYAAERANLPERPSPYDLKHPKAKK